MARLSADQIKKLTPAEKKARAARLEYNRAYDAAKKKGKKPVVVKKSQKITVLNRDKAEVKEAANRAQQISHLAAELDSVYERETQLLNEIIALSTK